MFSDSPLRAVILLLAVIAVIVQVFRSARGRRSGSGPRRRAGGVGAGAMGAVYDMLNEDKRRAIEIIVEHKAAAVDPERARDKDPKQTVRVAASADISDISEIVRVTNAAFRVEDFFIIGDRTYADDIRAKLAGERACFLVIDAPGGAGLMASAFVELRGDRGYFGMLSVDPAHQRKGLGRIMFNAIEARCRAAGCVALDISVVNLREELPAFYAMLGFTPTGTAPLLSHNTKRDAHFILMSKPLL